jgi:hypothetical protein
VGVRCIIPPRDLSELKTQAIPLTYPKVGKNFAVLDIFFMGYFTAGFQNINFDI